MIPQQHYHDCGQLSTWIVSPEKLTAALNCNIWALPPQMIRSHKGSIGILLTCLVFLVSCSPGGASGKKTTKTNCLTMQETEESQVQSLGQEDPWRRRWQSALVFLPGESHGWRSLVGCGPYGCEEFHKTEVTLHSWLLTKYGRPFTKQNLKKEKS